MEFSDNPLLHKSFQLSLAVIRFCTKLEAHKKFVVAKQLLRSATSVGANAVEAQSAESNADFIHKLKVADKEARETQYWLLLCQHAEDYPDCPESLALLEEVLRLLNAIIRTARQKENKKGGTASEESDNHP